MRIRPRLDQQDRGTRVDRPVPVQLHGQLPQRAVGPRQRLVGDEQVHRPGELTGGVEQPLRRGRVGEVGVHPGDGRRRVRPHLGQRVVDVVGAPRLRRVVRGEVVHDHGRAVRGEPAGGRVPDPSATATAGHERGPAAQRHRVRRRVLTPRPCPTTTRPREGESGRTGLSGGPDPLRRG